jgi:hypothetical protein
MAREAERTTFGASAVNLAGSSTPEEAASSMDIFVFFLVKASARVWFGDLERVVVRQAQVQRLTNPKAYVTPRRGQVKVHV